jgi:hypothetical protein
VLAVSRNPKKTTSLTEPEGTASNPIKDRLMAAMDYFNQQPIIHTWSYKLDRAK